VAAAQEERFSRVKHDHRFPDNAVRACLREAGIAVDALDCVAFYDEPFLKFDRILETHLTIAPRGLPAFVQAIAAWLGRDVRSCGGRALCAWPTERAWHGGRA
jgi:carbamoyltransferase